MVLEAGSKCPNCKSKLKIAFNAPVCHTCLKQKVGLTSEELQIYTNEMTDSERWENIELRVNNFVSESSFENSTISAFE